MTNRSLSISLFSIFIILGCAQKPIQKADAAMPHSSAVATDTSLGNSLKEKVSTEDLDTKALAQQAFPTDKTKSAKPKRAVSSKKTAPAKPIDNGKKVELAPPVAPPAKVPQEANPVVGNFFLDHWLLMMGLALVFVLGFGVFKFVRSNPS